MATEDELKQARLAHADQLAERGGLYPSTFRVTDDMERARRDFLALNDDTARREQLPTEEELSNEAPHIWLYGRVVAKRGPFVVIRTPHGDGQGLVRPDVLSETDAAQYAQMDLADHIAVRGPAMRTRTGAATVKALRFVHLGKALLPPPAKWHGLKDVEKRYRERYVDTFANPQVARVFRARARMIQEIRRFYDARGFLEVETPLLHPLRGGATARPFKTHHNALDLPLYLRIAPELYLKRLLVGGFERVYEIGRAFRNEGLSTRHNPEFTIVESYQAYAGAEELMIQTEELVRHVAAAVRTDFEDFGGEAASYTLEGPWPRVPMRELIAMRLERSGRDGIKPTAWDEALDADMLGDEAALSAAFERVQQSERAQRGPRQEKQEQEPQQPLRSYGKQIFFLYEELVEPHLTTLFRTPDGQRSVPVFVTDYPSEVSPLARKKDDDERFVDRFELFIEGREIANAFSELNDPRDQAERFRAQLRARSEGDEEAMDFDADYIRALEHGLPPAAGFGLGLDRFTMLLCNQPSIRDVLLFPLLRPEA